MGNVDKWFNLRIFGIRFLEFMIPSIIASALSVLFCDSGILMSKAVILLAMIVCFLLYVAAVFFQSAECYFQLRSKKTYYILSVLAYLVFSVLSVGMFFVLPRTGYCWIFGVNMFLTHFGMRFLISFFVFHIFVIAALILSPYYVDKTYKNKHRRF